MGIVAPLSPAPRRQRQECEFEAGLVYIVSYRALKQK